MNRICKITLAAAIVAASIQPVITSASQYVAPENPFHGFYLGAGINAVDLNDKINYATSAESITIRGGEHNIGASLFTGYGIPIQQFYLGAELFYRYTTPHSESQTLTSSTSSVMTSASVDKIKTDRDLGLALKAGYRIAPNTLFYILLGAENSRIKITNKVTIAGVNRNESFSKNKVGFMPGIGLATFITNNLLVNMQYTYTRYPSFKNTTTDNVLTTKTTPKRDIVTIGLAYQFGDSQISDEDKTYYSYMQSDPNYNIFNGFYLGAGLDAVNLNSDYNINETNYSLKLHGDDPQFGGNVFGGYSHVFCKFYLGGELFVRYTQPNDNEYGFSGGPQINKVKERHSYGANLKAGYQVTPSNLLYLLVGIESTDFEVTAKNSSNSQVIFSDTKQAFLPGVGLESAITSNLHIRGQYTYASYNSISKTSQGATFDIKPAKGTFTLALLWQFS